MMMMACGGKMAHLESLNSFFCQRLLAVAAEMFQAVKDTLSEYEAEMEICKQENCHLRRMVAELSLSGADAQAGQRDPLSPEDQTADRGPLDSDTSVIQVKVELSTVHPTPEQHPTSPCPVYTDPAKPREPPPLLPTHTGGDKDVSTAMDPCVSVKLEQSDSDVICSDSFNCLVPADHVCMGQLGTSEDDAGPHCSAHRDFPQVPFRLQSPYKVCGTHFGNDGLSKTQHRGRAFRCGLCEKSYSTAHALKIHLRTHTGERPYPCKYCEKTFNQKAHLKEHERIHTGEKPYSCSACGKHFNRTYQVKVHIQNYHPDEVATIIKSQEYK